MATKQSGGNNTGNFARMLLEGQFKAYLKVAMRKHDLPPDEFKADVKSMSDEEILASITVLRDLAHLPPE